MSARGEMVDLIEDAIDDVIYNAADAPPSLSGMVALTAADALIAAGYRKPRTITTFDGLTELPSGSVVRDNSGGVFERRGEDWCGYGCFPLSDKHLSKYLPVEVLA